MKEASLLINRLKEYHELGIAPFHMPGHKQISLSFPNPYEIDITEIEGFDNLHHPEGILKRSMEWAADVYGAKHTEYLINGSSCGILSGICAATTHGGKILMSRNCHKSAYHGVILGGLETAYVYPHIIEELGIQGGILPEDVEIALREHPDTQAVLIVSPTYDGVVSDVERIAKVVHERGIPLLVDEAHGAHFPFGEAGGFPVSALYQGADLVVQSLHKTLGAFTQTAILHVQSDRIAIPRLKQYLQMFQSSSPSYLLMAGLERCIWDVDNGKTNLMTGFSARLKDLYEGLKNIKNGRLITGNICGHFSVFDWDWSKVVYSAKGCARRGEDESDLVLADGAWMMEYLRQEHNLELEMCGADYVVALTSVFNEEADMIRLKRGLLDLDRQLVKTVEEKKNQSAPPKQRAVCTLAAATESAQEVRDLEACAGLVSGEFIYLYPPGIPLVAPGEVVTEAVIGMVEQYRKAGLPIQGMEDYEAKRLRVLI